MPTPIAHRLAKLKRQAIARLAELDQAPPPTAGHELARLLDHARLSERLRLLEQLQAVAGPAQ